VENEIFLSEYHGAKETELVPTWVSSSFRVTQANILLVNSIFSQPIVLHVAYMYMPFVIEYQ